MPTSRYCTLFLLLTFAFTLSSAAAASEQSVLDEISGANERFDNRAVPLTRQVTEETVLARETYQGGSFKVLSRKSQIERYKCSSCHTTKAVIAQQGLELTHGSVVIKHGEQDQGLICIDCHHPRERDFLEDKKGSKIDFDHSYQLCGQCHFRQKRDWLGGAHGKRVANWAGERTIYNCTTCHDPHAPRFKKRFPATYSVDLD